MHWPHDQGSYFLSVNISLGYQFVLYRCSQVILTEIHTVVNSTMPALTTALCMRLHPFNDGENTCTRMDVWGCNQTQYPPGN